jgi:pectin methylesterase-like acyl-CoA thioesterase
MIFRMVLFVTSAFLLTSITLSLQGAQWYIDAAVPGSGNGQSPDAAFKTIQEGIDAASPGDTVIVAEGTYVEKIEFKGKNIILRTSDPADRTVVENTIIDGNKGGAVVTFAGTEDETCVLSGFTIQNGEAGEGAGICGGTAEQHTLATIENNVVADNAAQFGGGDWLTATARSDET